MTPHQKAIDAAARAMARADEDDFTDADWERGGNIKDMYMEDAKIAWEAGLASARESGCNIPKIEGESTQIKRVRHKKRGSTYRIIGAGTIQTAVPLVDMEPVVIYQSEHDGSLWARSPAEFHDGRFEDVP